MLDLIKIALRINHNYLDDDINSTIEVARADASRSGVPVELMNDTNNSLVISLIKTYCLYTYAEDLNVKDKYWESYLFQLDNLRKSTIERG